MNSSLVLKFITLKPICPYKRDVKSVTFSVEIYHIKRV